MSADKHNNPKPNYVRKPEWLKIRLPNLNSASKVIGVLEHRCLNTICTSGMCPNRAECWENGMATFMIGGDVCTRACRFCAVKTGNPHGAINHAEIEDIAESVKTLGLKHVVITSVDRDDLPDGGASHWARLIKTLKTQYPHLTIETLIPDFQGKSECVDMIVEARPDVISHNLETVERLTPSVRSVATYRRSLGVIQYVANKGIRAKSGIMVGLGETRDEVYRTMDDLLEVGCRVLTIGQYLQPSEHQLPVVEYITPQQFEEYRLEGLSRGFRFVESAPFVRSSYHAHRHARD